MIHPLETIHPRNLKHLSHYLQDLIRARLWVKILVGMVLGLTIGFMLGPDVGLVDRELADTLGQWLALPGRVFLTLVQMIVIPLVLASVIRGIAATNDIDQLRRLGVRLVLYFLMTTTIAVSIGVGVAALIRPGSYVDFAGAGEVTTSEVREEIADEEPGAQSLPDSFISILPKNPLSEAVEMQMLQVVLFSIIFGVALVSLQPKQSKPLLDLLGSVQSVSMAIVKWTMMIAPFAVFGLLAKLTIETGIDSLIGVGVYVATIITGLAAMLLVYLAIMWLVGGKTPAAFLRAVREVQLLAFSTGSSVAVMPLSIKTAEEKLGARPSTSQFVIPIGATVNMDATSLFQGAATIFLTQVYGLDLSVGMIAVLILTVIGSSIGTPATPGVGIVVLSVVLNSVGVPLDGLALIIGVDRILEMMRTSINVTGDLVATVVMDRLGKLRLARDDEVAQEATVEHRRRELGEDVVVEPGGSLA